MTNVYVHAFYGKIGNLHELKGKMNDIEKQLRRTENHNMRNVITYGFRNEPTDHDCKINTASLQRKTGSGSQECLIKRDD